MKMNKRRVSTRILTKIYKIIILLYIFSLLLFFTLPIANANPVMIETMGSGQLAPQYETRVYLKSEDIRANISDIVTERCEYILQNSENMNNNLSIALPLGIKHFDYNLPDNITLTINGTVCAYIWGSFNFTNMEGYNWTCYAIIFNLTFAPFEEKIIVANYSRHFSVSEGIRAYHYITETGRFWNRSIETARFNYRLALNMGKISIAGLEGYSTHFERNKLVISKEFHDWVPTTNIGITFDLRGPDSNLSALLLFISWILILLLITLILYRISKNKSERNKKLKPI
jgi:hypothetical protein